MKFDIVTWVKDGEWYLPITLKRLEDVLPSEFVHRKIAVDDHSTDDTVEILKEFGWEVYDNLKTGISSGANYALSKVDCPLFMSFEQDLYLAREWWDKVSPLLDQVDVAVASGVRLASQPSYLTAFERYVLDRDSGFSCGKTLDQTLYKTRIIRSLGGFPYSRSNTGVDTVLRYVLFVNGFEWSVDKSAVSVHLRKSGVSDAIRHQFWYATGIKEKKVRIKGRASLVPPETFLKLMLRFLYSPFRGLEISFKVREPRICVLYPLLRLASCLGYLRGNANLRLS